TGVQTCALPILGGQPAGVPPVAAGQIDRGAHAEARVLGGGDLRDDPRGGRGAPRIGLGEISGVPVGGVHGDAVLSGRRAGRARAVSLPVWCTACRRATLTKIPRAV